jgi:PST family polysaccharide transporter
MVVWRDWFSRQIFGTPTESTLVVWLAVCLATVVLHNFLTALFIAVRMYRVVTALQFAQGVGFAVVSVGLLMLRPQGAVSVVIGYAVATLLAALVSVGWLTQLAKAENIGSDPVPQRAFWARLVPFAIWIWLTNLISNVFDVVDRYMILHYSDMPPDGAIAQVGYYHSSRIIPLLFVGVAALLASMITPHLTTDWELGRHKSVVKRLNLALKLLALSLLAASAAVLVIAPTLFTTVFRNKFEGGLEVLPCTLAYCGWFGLFAVAQNYLWCAERAALSSLPLVVGLAMNVALNLLWLPVYGLPGAVWATTLSNLAALVLTYQFSRWYGMQVDPGTWIISLALGGLCFGPWTALTVLAVVLLLACATELVFHADEKQQLVATATEGLAQFKLHLRRSFARRATSDAG